LSKWDSWIRFTGFGELALSIITLIFVRTRTAVLNARTPARARDDEFPDSIDAGARSRAAAPAFDREASPALQIASRESGEASPDGLKELQEICSLISYQHPGKWYAVDLRDDHVRVRLRTRRDGREITLKTAKLTLDVLRDVITMDRGSFTA